ncbi:Ubiquitin carboxyl-terminal hydrolase [Actinidia chinensis var. chinensis]|uniref:Ubiquitin carboxyl-terminal hydrolase n=1 Tax=Actinidia chinensis var. chinensis TaxID=1590841 RepID=A0A2R6QZG4_ACTCC|nr:Ubiquitin carboxyl-terminal hydrolase [Actinidia chinensis var. chinensis]
MKKHQPQHQQSSLSSEAVSSSSEASVSASSTSSPHPLATAQSEKSAAVPVPAAEDPAVSRDGAGGQESVVLERRGDSAAVCKWTISNFPKVKTRALWSKYFEVGGYDCRLLVYPKGDSQALPGYISIYLQIMDPRGTSSSKWDCFASYRLAVVNPIDNSKSIHRDSWHRFSSKKKSHGWCDFTPSASIIDPKSGFLLNNDSILITADILILNESVSFSRDNNELQSNGMLSSIVTGPVGDVLNGKFTWKVHNFSLFKEMIKTQKIMSPVFPAGECNLRISVYQSSVNGVEYLSMCLESKDTEKTSVPDRSCWCLFRMSVLNQKTGLNHMHRDSYGRFAADNKSGDNTSLGWNDYMKMSDFIGSESGFLVDDMAVFSTSFHVIKELSSFSKNGGLIGVRSGGGVRKSDGHMGKFTWRIDNFTRLKDLLKKRKITGLCIKSRRFQIGNRDCRLIVYPRAPKHLQPDLVALVPKLVEHSEHPLAACALLDRLQGPDAEPALRVPVFGALSQLDCSTEVWERILFQSFALLADSNDEPLEATMDFILKAALQCQHLPQAVRALRVRLKDLGTVVSSSVLDYLSRMVNSCADVAEAILREIDCDDDFGDNNSEIPCGLFTFGVGPTSERLHVVDEGAFFSNSYFSDIFLLIEMLSIPCLAVEASQTFERAVARGAIVAQSVAMVLERRLAQRLNFTSQFVTENFQHADVVVEGETIEQLRSQRDDFTSVLGLAETLALSRDPRVRGFVKMLYTILFKWSADESYRLRMLKRLIDRATSTTDSSREVDIDLEILVILVCEEQEIVRPVLSMMREVAELANVDRAALWHQLCASEDEIIRICEERKSEISTMAKEKAIISQKMSESEAATNRLKSEMRAETDRFARERKDLSEQIQDLESQLEWLRSERDDEVGKLTAEKKVLQDRLHDTDTQLSLLKSRKRDELKRVMKEKNALAERLKSAEAARKRFDEELKRYATENVTREEIRQSLEDEVRRLTQTVGQTEGEKREKEEQVTRCEAYIDGMEAKLQACQQYIHSLETSLQEEMTRHAPLYGAGLEALSMKELDTLSRIHEEGLRQIHALQQRKGSPAGSPLVGPHTLPHSHGLYAAVPPPMAVGLPPSLIPNGVIHSNGHVNGSAGPWFNHT